MHHVFLLPGFFGFTHLGEIIYFGHVREVLETGFARRGQEVSVVAIKSHPTASVRTRARQTLEVIEAAAAHSDAPIHLIGHSTGGLDARLLLSPGADLGGATLSDAIADRVKTLVTVSTPHRGTPLANFFLGLAGAQMLRLLSVFTSAVLRRGKLPVRLVLRLANLLVRADDQVLAPGLVDQVFTALLGDLSEDRRNALLTFMQEMREDQALIAQLTPDAVELFSAVISNRPGVRLGSVVTRAAPPTWRTRVASGISPYAQVTHTVYVLLHGWSAKLDPRVAIVSSEHAQALATAYGEVPKPADNDGIVPTLSQPFGEIIAAVAGDHLDAIGHFDAPRHRPAHYDWLVSGSGFDRAAFDDTWDKVTSFLLAR